MSDVKKRANKGSRFVGFTKSVYRFLWRHRVILIKLVLWLIKIIYENGKSE